MKASKFARDQIYNLAFEGYDKRQPEHALALLQRTVDFLSLKAAYLGARKLQAPAYKSQRVSDGLKLAHIRRDLEAVRERMDVVRTFLPKQET